MYNFIPFSKPTIDVEEQNSVLNVLNSGWLTVGKKCKEFEENIQKYTGTDFAVVVDSCTSALTLSMRAIKESYFKYEVPIALIPALTFVATANAAYHAGCSIKFCDVDWDGNIAVESAKEDFYDLIVPVHYAGQAVDLQKILNYFPMSYIIEDAAHAIGLQYGSRHIGNITDGACFSFYPTKNMTTIEGGAFVTNRKEVADSVRSLSLHGLDSSHVNRYERSSLNKPTVTIPGYKSNMTDVEAAIGIEQLKKLDYFIRIRKLLSKIYFQELDGKVRFLEQNGREHVRHMFVILVDDRDNFVTKMKERGIGVGVHYSPIIPAHPFYKEETNYKVGDFPVAEYISEHCVSLPLFPTMTENEQERIIKTVKELV